MIADKQASAALQHLDALHSGTNDTYWDLFFDEHRFLVLKGGGGSGKSIFAGRKVLERVTTEPGHRWLVCRKVARTLRESCYQQLISQAWEYCADSAPKQNKSDMTISFKNGSQILFAGLDDVEKLKSIYNITGIWIEEASEITEADFNQLDIRLRGKTKYYKQIILTFNPVSITHWLKKRFFDTADDRVMTHESTYKDNRFLDDEAKKTLEAFKDTDEYYYTVYCLGQWGVTGKSVFDAKAITRRLSELPEPVKTGFFTYTDNERELNDIAWVDDKDGFIRVYAEPEEGVPYVIGGDTAGNGSDSFVAQVLDNRTGAQVCTLRRQFDEDVFARQVFCLGKYYNTALIGLETNFSTYPVRELERLGYKRQYVRETIDDYTHSVICSFGFVTNQKTRPVIISELIKVTREDATLLNDRITMEEMLTFVRGEDWKPQAEAGAHDDCVMSLAIAHFIRPQQEYSARRKDAGANPARHWTKDMWDDYYAADPETRKHLMKKWSE